jgi:hypothetical protein
LGEFCGELGDGVGKEDSALAGGGKGITLDALKPEGEGGKGVLAFEVAVGFVASTIEGL